MSGYLREFLADAKKLGFVPDGTNGNGHVRLVNHDTGARYNAPSTPSDWRSVRNAIATLERISGRKLPRQHAGKHHHHRVTPLDVHRTATETRVCAEVDDLLAQADTLRHQFAALIAAPNQGRDQVAGARKLLTEYETLRRCLEMRHRIIGPITGEE